METPPAPPPAPAGPVPALAAPDRRALWAYVGPFALFLALLFITGAVRDHWFGGVDSRPNPYSWAATRDLWIFLAQTLPCAALLLFYQREYPMNAPRWAVAMGVAVGVVMFLVWITPQAFLHLSGMDRARGGFNPLLLAPAPNAFYEVPANPINPQWNLWATLTVRFVRLVVVIPVLEEVFWRGFVLRYLVREDFTNVPFGAFSGLSFAVATIGFTFEHSQPDWAAAFATGIVYNLLAIRTRSLPACIVAHAVTNLLLGVYVLMSHQWGYW